MAEPTQEMKARARELRLSVRELTKGQCYFVLSHGNADAAIAAALSEAFAAGEKRGAEVEREACAKICEKLGNGTMETPSVLLSAEHACARAIRSRGGSNG